MQKLAPAVYFLRFGYKSTSIKTADAYDIHTSQQAAPYLLCREPNLSFFSKLGRFIGVAEFDFVVTDEGGARVFRLRKKTPFIGAAKITLHDADDTVLGRISRPVFSLKNSYKFEGNAKDSSFIVELGSKMTGYDFLIGGKVVGSVNLGWKEEYPKAVKERFSHCIQLNDDLQDPLLRTVVFAIGVAILKLRT